MEAVQFPEGRGVQKSQQKGIRAGKMVQCVDRVLARQAWRLQFSHQHSKARCCYGWRSRDRPGACWPSLLGWSLGQWETLSQKIGWMAPPEECLWKFSFDLGTCMHIHEYACTHICTHTKDKYSKWYHVEGEAIWTLRRIGSQESGSLSVFTGHYFYFHREV